MKLVRRIAAGLVVLIALPILALAGCQRSLLYFPRADIVAPQTAGVEAVRINTSDGETLTRGGCRRRMRRSPCFSISMAMAGGPRRGSGGGGLSGSTARDFWRSIIVAIRDRRGGPMKRGCMRMRARATIG